MRRGIACGLASAALGTLVLAAQASATFHLISIREVAPNPSGAQTAFIELQMYAPGQTQLAGHSIRIYDADGVPAPMPFALTDAANGENQRTYLIGDDATSPPPDFLNQQLQPQLNGPAGAVCFDTIDCVAWGAFTGTGLPSPPGPPAPAISDGSSLTRSIAPGCATLLEATDDTNNSSADFALAAPSPRNNATAPTETACVSADTDPPQTTITKSPKDEFSKARAKLKFRSSEPGSDFRCKLDQGGFKPCDSPFKKRVDLGKHKFKVFAIDAAGNRDPTPAKDRFRRVDD